MLYTKTNEGMENSLALIAVIAIAAGILGTVVSILLTGAFLYMNIEDELKEKEEEDGKE